MSVGPGYLSSTGNTDRDHQTTMTSYGLLATTYPRPQASRRVESPSGLAMVPNPSSILTLCFGTRSVSPTSLRLRITLSCRESLSPCYCALATSSLAILSWMFRRRTRSHRVRLQPKGRGLWMPRIGSVGWHWAYRGFKEGGLRTGFCCIGF